MTMTEPTTEAGRALLAWLNAEPGIVYATPDSILAIEAEAAARVVAEYNDGPSGPALIPYGEPCPVCGPNGHARHEDDSYGSCITCREYQPHTDMTHRPVAFPCAVVREAEAVAAERQRIDALRRAIDASIQDLNLVWSTCADDERLHRAITRLQHAATNDDIANGRDWRDPALASEDRT